MITDEKLKQIADHYGIEGQLLQAIEEMAELTQALSKFHRYGNNRSDVAEEIADVLIMTSQIGYLLDIEPEEIEKNIEAKIERQLKRMEEQHE